MIQRRRHRDKKALQRPEYRAFTPLAKSGDRDAPANNGKKLVTRMGLEPMTTGLKEESGAVGSAALPSTCEYFPLASPNPSCKEADDCDQTSILKAELLKLSDEEYILLLLAVTEARQRRALS